MSTVHGLEELCELLSKNRQSIQYSAGDVIFEQGDVGDRMYVVREGSVELKAGDKLVDTAAAPGLFGEMALIDDEPRALTAVAGTEVQLVDIPARHFWVLVHETPYFAQLVMTVMARRLRAAGQTT